MQVRMKLFSADALLRKMLGSKKAVITIANDGSDTRFDFFPMNNRKNQANLVMTSKKDGSKYYEVRTSDEFDEMIKCLMDTYQINESQAIKLVDEAVNK